MSTSREKRRKKRKRGLQKTQKGSTRMFARGFHNVRKEWGTRIPEGVDGKADYDRKMLAARREFHEASGNIAPNRKQRRSRDGRKSGPGYTTLTPAANKRSRRRRERSR